MAGLQHKTNRFAGGVTGAKAFAAPGGWPPLTHGPEVVETLAGTSVPSAGALDVLDRAGVDVVPLLWAMTSPSGPVDHAAYAAMRDEIVAGLRAAAPLDGVFLGLHGAVVTTAEDDAEGDLLDAVRSAVGPSVPVVATLDLRGNLTTLMVAATDWIEPYPPYPHVNMAGTQRADGGAVVLADVQDNPRGAAPLDTTGLLRALIDARAEGAVLVHIAIR